MQFQFITDLRLEKFSFYFVPGVYLIHMTHLAGKMKRKWRARDGAEGNKTHRNLMDRMFQDFIVSKSKSHPEFTLMVN